MGGATACLGSSRYAAPTATATSAIQPSPNVRSRREYGVDRAAVDFLPMPAAARHPHTHTHQRRRSASPYLHRARRRTPGAAAWRQPPPSRQTKPTAPSPTVRVRLSTRRHCGHHCRPRGRGAVTAARQRTTQIKGSLRRTHRRSTPAHCAALRTRRTAVDLRADLATKRVRGE
jgi:hypothetical protein